MKKIRLVFSFLLLVVLFSQISANDTQTKPSATKGGGIVKDSQLPTQKAEENRAYKDAYFGTMNDKIEFLKKYSDNVEKTKLVDLLLYNPIRSVGFTGRISKILKYTPNWKYVAFLSNDHRIFVMEAETKNIVRVIDDQRYINTLSISNNGKYLAYSYSVLYNERDAKSYRKDKIKRKYVFEVQNLTNGEILSNFEINHYGVRDERLLFVTFTEDSKQLIAGYRNTVITCDIENGKKLKEYNFPDANINIAMISPDMKYIAFGGSIKTVLKNEHGNPLNKGFILIQDAQTGETVLKLLEDLTTIRVMEFTSNSKYIVTQTENNKIKVCEVITGKEIRSFRGHDEEVTNFVVSPNTKYLISISKNQNCKIWDFETGKEIRTIYEFSNLTSVKFENDYMLVADGLNRWRVSLKSPEQTLIAPEGKILSVCYSPDGTRFAASTDTGKIRIWNTGIMDVARDIEADMGATTQIMFLVDKKTIIASTSDGIIKLWDINTGNLTKEFKAHEGKITSIDISPDGEFLVTGSVDKTAKIWKFSDYSLQKTIDQHSDIVSGVDYSPNGKYLATCSYDKSVKIWNVSDWSIVNDIILKHKTVTYVKFTADSQSVFYTHDRFITNQRIDNKKEFSFVNDYVTKPNSICVSNDGKYLASTNTGDKVNIWDLTCERTGDTSLPDYKFKNRTSNANAACFSPDGKTLITGDYEYEHSDDKQVIMGKIRLWDTKSIELIHRHIDYSYGISDSDISPDNKLIAYALYGRNKIVPDNVQIWNFETGSFVKKFEGHKDNVICVKFSPDGKILASSSQGNQQLSKELGNNPSEIKLWDVESGKLLNTIKVGVDGVWDIEFSPDSKYLISMGKNTTVKEDTGHSYYTGTLAKWEVATGKLVLEFSETIDPKVSDLSKDTSEIIYSPEGKYIAYVSSIHGDQDKFGFYYYTSKLYLWNAKTGEMLRKDVYKDKLVNSIHFLDGGKTLLTCERDLVNINSETGSDKYQGFIRFRDVETGKILRELTHGETSYKAFVSPDEKTLYVNSYLRYQPGSFPGEYCGYSVIVWDIKTGDLIQMPHYLMDINSKIDFTSDSQFIIVDGQQIFPTLQYIESQVGKETLYNHLHNFTTVKSLINTFWYAAKDSDRYYYDLVNWNEMKSNHTDITVKDLKKLYSHDSFQKVLYYFRHIFLELKEDEIWLTEKDGEYFAYYNIKMAPSTNELKEWTWKITLKLSKRKFAWEIVDFGNFPTDCMGLSKILIKEKNNKYRHWEEYAYLFTPKQKTNFEKERADNPDYIPIDRTEYYAKIRVKILEKFTK